MMTNKQLMALLVLVLTVCSAAGQDKKDLTPADYHRWYHFYQYALSPDGRWMNYIVGNPTGQDTMVLRKTDHGAKQLLLGGINGRFAPKSDWFAFLKNGKLFYQGLKGVKKDSVAGIDDYFYSKGGRYLVGYRRQEKELVVIHLGTDRQDTISSTGAYSLSPDSTRIAFVRATEATNILSVVELSKRKAVRELACFAQNISGLTWNNAGNGLAFFEELQGNSTVEGLHRLHCLTFGKKGLFSAVHHEGNILPQEYQIPASRLFFSLDDARLFFDVKTVSKAEDNNQAVQIWHSNDTKLPPPGMEKTKKSLMCWHLESDQFLLAGGKADAVPTAIGKHALIIDESPYLPHFKHRGFYVDLYLNDLSTGKRKRIARKVNHQKKGIVVSPGGKYISWFAGANWWIYDIREELSSCLTCTTEASFENLDYDSPGERNANEKPYWTAGDKAVILTDFYDVWVFDPKTKKRERITNAAGSDSYFRVHDPGFIKTKRDYFLPYQSESCNLESGIILKEVNRKTLEEGFSCYQSGKALKRICYGDDKIDPIYKSGNTYMYVQSDFDKAPELIVQQSGRISSEVVQRSNEHQKEFHWGRSELIHYSVRGAAVKGALFYPADYKPDRCYPMVVYIYEKMSSLLRRYVAPTLYGPIGFNVTDLTASGYFVLYPDISYRLNQTGKSALESVAAAVAKALETASIDSGNVGLYGHSFGGYEVSYIIGQTSLFKTAVSGSGWHDLVDTYLDADEMKVSNIWRFDTQQLRITAPFTSEQFLENSPIRHADAISTPLLLWTGMDDYRVNWKNSVKMQTALWRFGKESTLLLYPKEQHFLTSPKNQEDLSLKTKAWFDYYLKGADKPEWIK